MTITTVTRRVEFDAGHRIPDHGSKCRNIHGHRYVLEVTATGKIIDSFGEPDHGMLIDFGELKKVMMDVIGEPWDHSLILWNEDPLCNPEFLQMLASVMPLDHDHKTVVLACVPTVENLANVAFERISEALQYSNLQITQVRLYETPNCWSDALLAT